MSQSLTQGSHVHVARLVALLLTPAFGGGCAQTLSSFDANSELQKYESTARVTVENRLLRDVGVYAIVGGARYRLGAVETLRTRTFTVPRVISLPSEIELYVAAMADGEDYTTPPILVRRGGSILLNVENPARYSTVLWR